MFRNSRGSPRRAWAIGTSSGWTPRWLSRARPSSVSTVITTFDAGRRRLDTGRGPVKPVHSLAEKGKDMGSTHRAWRRGGLGDPRSRNHDGGTSDSLAPANKDESPRSDDRALTT